MIDFILQRGRYKKISEAILLLFPLIVFSFVFVIFSRSIWGLIFALIPLVLGIIILKYFSHNLFDKIAYYLFFIGSILYSLFYLMNVSEGGSGAGFAMALGSLGFIFWVFFGIWFIIKLFMKFKIYLTLNIKGFKQKTFSNKTFSQKTGIVFTIILFLLNLFIIWTLSTCRDWNCIGAGLLSFLTGLGFIGLAITNFIFHVEPDSSLGILVLFITALILTPVYYFIGKLIGRVISKILGFSKKVPQPSLNNASESN